MRLALLAVPLLLAPPAIGEPLLRLERGVRADGTATDARTEGIAVAIGRERAEELARERRPFDDGDLAWWRVLEAARPAIEARAAGLVESLGVEPLGAVIVAGNRGSSDGFGWAPRSIGINLSAFRESYGAPDSDAADRMARIVAHEYLHLLTYAAWPRHRELRTTPFDRALWTLFFEGIGDFVSMSARWHPAPAGTPSPAAAEALARLEPELVARLEALAGATPEEEPGLREGISMGRFDRKWGSLPFALWLRAEAAQIGEAEALRRAFRLGPAGVLPLALRHASPALRPRLEALARRLGEDAV